MGSFSLLILAQGGLTLFYKKHDVITHVERLTRYLENELKEQVKGLPPSRGEVLARAKIEFDNTAS